MSEIYGKLAVLLVLLCVGNALPAIAIAEATPVEL
jgi:hypothetical protein